MVVLGLDWPSGSWVPASGQNRWKGAPNDSLFIEVLDQYENFLLSYWRENRYETLYHQRIAWKGRNPKGIMFSGKSDIIKTLKRIYRERTNKISSS